MKPFARYSIDDEYNRLLLLTPIVDALDLMCHFVTDMVQVANWNTLFNLGVDPERRWSKGSLQDITTGGTVSFRG